MSSTIPIILPCSNLFIFSSTFPLATFNSPPPIVFPEGMIAGTAVLAILNNSWTMGSLKKVKAAPVEMMACRRWAWKASAWPTLNGMSRPLKTYRVIWFCFGFFGGGWKSLDASLDEHGHVEHVKDVTEIFALGNLIARAAFTTLPLAFSQFLPWFLTRCASMASLTPCVLPAASHAEN